MSETLTRCRTCDLYEEGEHVPCHKCGHLDGDILPGCMGSINGRDSCCCVKPKRKDAIVARLERIEARLTALEDSLPGPDNGIDLTVARADRAGREAPR